MIYLFHGDDTVACEEALRQLVQQEIPEGSAELAVSRLEGESISLALLMEHCEALPFLSPKRLVIVEGLSGYLKRGGLLQQLQDYLPRMASSTVLVLRERQSLSAKHALLSLVKKVGQVREFAPPQGRDLSRWIAQQARREGAEISPAACDLLAATVGTDPALILREVEKLVTYVGPDGRIEEHLVAELASQARLSNIFVLVDAIGQRRQARALQELQRLLQAGQPPLYILTMVVRQFRLLLQVKGLPAGQQEPAQVARVLKQHPFVAKKISRQARLFQRSELEQVYQRLLETDREIKTGRRDAEVALELLIVAASAPPR
ncbi:MAG: DNA polymerase III subunit delta [Chloroflexia bacterium]|nr:DNA polymerase III subunit delta [Chloroflexia bacterium]